MVFYSRGIEQRFSKTLEFKLFPSRVEKEYFNQENETLICYLIIIPINGKAQASIRSREGVLGLSLVTAKCTIFSVCLSI